MNRIITIGLNTARGFASPVFNFLIAILGIKFFGKENWGTLINVMLWIFFIVFSIGWGNREYLIRAYSKQPSKIYYAFYSNLFSRSLLLPYALLLFIFFPKNIALLAVIMVILMHLYNAMDSLVVYHQVFSAQLIAEVLSFTTIICGIFLSTSFNLESFLQWYCLAFLTKIICLIIALKLWKEKLSFTISLNELKAGASFFLLGLSGWLASKIDVYIIDFYLPKARLSEYQLLITAFLMLQALSAYLIIPFTKHLYRLSDDVVKKMQKKLYIIAVPLVSIGCFAIYIVMEYFVKLQLHSWYYCIGGLIALPSFFYTLDIMKLMKKHQERKIILVNCIGFVVNFILILILIRTYEIYGVLLSVCISQWVTLFIYKLTDKKSTI
ncbi:hypothetical protein Q4512_05795 [Oceanihabitans sp. 2_MG-2023]|uniref:lipopolysaccharide biosynthesis protein n=1 Tax=Oceanihabitans sp. 2_MG-2023 TaxID=3062661 RepID=UPI0026E3F9F1|nr:hypothetical protein [Oceanihabitans sp. 2_MG-2023]MDO6596418.1 hypothetical protein [Oceanihabitans sp. 2_MG-2023]